MRGRVVAAKQFEQRSRSSSRPGWVTSSQRLGTMPQFQQRSSAASVMLPLGSAAGCGGSGSRSGVGGWQGLRARMRRRNLTVPRQTARGRRLRLSARLKRTTRLNAREGEATPRREPPSSSPSSSARPLFVEKVSLECPPQHELARRLCDLSKIDERVVGDFVSGFFRELSPSHRQTHRSIRLARLTASGRARLHRRGPRPTAANTTEGSAVAARVLASRSPARVVPGPPDLLTRVAYPSQDGPARTAAGPRGEHPNAV